MNEKQAFFRLVRPINLLLVGAACMALKFNIIDSLVSTSPVIIESPVSNVDFFLMSLMLVLLTAAGNIINDYFDLRVDRLNKPNRVLIDKHIRRRIAMAGHIAFNVLAVGIGLYLSWKWKSIPILVLPFFISGSLWYYSVSFKRQFLSGNLVVALLAALLPMSIGLLEIPPITVTYGPEIGSLLAENGIEGDPSAIFKGMWTWILSYSAFCFALTLIREIQKDMEDEEGDRMAGFHTMAVVLGLRRSKYVAGCLLMASIISLARLGYFLYESMETYEMWTYLILFGIVMVLPLLISFITTMIAKDKAQYAQASLYTKLAMAGMILYTIVFAYNINPDRFIF